MIGFLSFCTHSVAGRICRFPPNFLYKSCGFTPRYEGVEKLYRTYWEQGFKILAFHCNQFGHQTPGSDAEIGQLYSLNYDATFFLASKI